MEQTNNYRRPRRSCVEQNRSTQGYWLGILLIVFIVLFDLLGIFSPDKSFSDNENRKLAQIPTYSSKALLDGSYFAEWEDYVADQFFGRDFWITLRLKCAKLFGQTESNGVYLGDDDYLIQIPTEPDWNNVDGTLAAVNDFARRHEELNINMMIVPNAVSVLSDKLPANAPGRDQAADLKYISSALEGVTFLDPSAALNKHSQEPLYYRTDHHWTSLAASYAFSATAKAMDIGSVSQGYEVYTVSTSFEGTLASKSGDHSVRDVIEIYVPKTDAEYRVTYEDTQEKTCSLYQRDCLFEKDQYTVFFGGNHPKITIETTVDCGRTLLLLKDSYANCYVQFLYPYYDEIVMIDPRYYYDNLEAVITREGVTDVLFLYNADTFLSDTSLKDVLTVE